MRRKAANDNVPRDPEFDRKLLAYEPAIRKMARRIAKHDDATEELFQQAMLLMLRRHTNCRLEMFWTWASFNVRNAAQEFIIYNSTQSRSADVRSLDTFEELPFGVDATQHKNAELSAVIGNLRGREGEMVLRHAMGDTLDEIGQDYGIGKERVRQLIERERLRLTDLMEAA
jgi:RNA polymerase sigma factor (sigma-70 family)